MIQATGNYVLPANRELGVIQNNDIDNILFASSGRDMTPQEYLQAVGHLLEGGPKVLAQNVGLPEAVIYRTEVDNTLDKYLLEVSLKMSDRMEWTEEDDTLRMYHALKRLFEAGTDPLALTIEACRAHGTAVLASYRMNAEDWYENTWLLSDFGRAHPDWRMRLTDEEKLHSAKAGVPIGFRGCLDPAIPGVFEHRMQMFSEMLENYDIDGIEFDFRRWTHMISDPHHNHPILTNMVRKTRRLLDETTRRKGRKRMMLGARIGPSIDDPIGTVYPGGRLDIDISNRLLGLDVRTWINENLVDYVCPSLFDALLPGLPNIREFVQLALQSEVGVYPTVFGYPAWSITEPGVGISMNELPPERVAGMMQRHRNEICRAAMRCFGEGAHGISTYNFFGHSLYSPLARKKGFPDCTHPSPRRNKQYRSSLANAKTELFAHSSLGSPEDIQRCLRARPVVGDGKCEWQVDSN